MGGDGGGVTTGSGADGGAGVPDGGSAPPAAPYVWSREATSLARLAAVWASGPGDVWATPRLQHSRGDGQWAAQQWSWPVFAPLDVSGSGPHDLYVATYEPGAGGTGRLFHSTGDGTWTEVPAVSGYQQLAVYAHDASVYVGTTAGGGLWRSTDHAASFAAVAASDGWNVYDIDGSGNDVAAVAMPNGRPANEPPGYLAVSHDDGASWAVAPTTIGLHSLTMRGGIVYAVTNASASAILRSDDDGVSWRDVTPRGTATQPYALFAVSADELWATDTSGHGLMHTLDGGQTWTLDLGATDALYGVYGAGPDDIYATGVDLIVHGHR